MNRRIRNKVNRERKKDCSVLVGVIKNRRDLGILFNERWYRIPVRYMPKRAFEYLAFYEPVSSFKWGGKCIRYYARVAECRTVKRVALLPLEERHLRAQDDYVRIRVGAIRELPHPVWNVLPRRVSFGFTTLQKLRTAKNIISLYGVADTEAIMRDAFRRADIRVDPQWNVLCGKKGEKKRFRIDFAIKCRRGMIAIECDNTKAHSSVRQRERDKEKDAVLRRYGWTVIRCTEQEIISNTEKCIMRVKRTIKKLGGV
ncbi:MAG: DUF559 domain-containing protein [Patescibacteria group bacterium]|nr:DUF559 domain-containing protein [Patescibacteria group bacterium]